MIYVDIGLGHGTELSGSFSKSSAPIPEWQESLHWKQPIYQRGITVVVGGGTPRSAGARCYHRIRTCRAA